MWLALVNVIVAEERNLAKKISSVEFNKTQMRILRRI